jgi:hypothetical protein
MKTIIVGALCAGFLLLSGCGPKAGPPAAASSPKAAGVAEPALSAWQKGDKDTAVSRFVEIDWSARPLFASGSTLNLSEDQFKALTDADRQARSGELMAQIDSLKRLASAVADAGREAAAKGDTAQAKKTFGSLQQMGTALNSPDRLTILQLVGKTVKKMGDAGAAKLAP